MSHGDFSVPTGRPSRMRPGDSAVEPRDREQWRLFLLAAPALLVIGLLLILPLVWLIVLSFYDGSWSIRHYQRMIEDSAYLGSFMLTFRVSGIITVCTIVIGYPLAYFIVQLPTRWQYAMVALVLIPFWTSLLVRSYAWLVLLQRNGLINMTLLESGLIAEPLELVHNVTGTVIGTVHVLLPFFVLPVYTAMRSIDMDLIRAASVLGATHLRCFWMIFVPLSLPGVLAGAMLVFVLSIGYYITPAILGGGSTVMIGMLIERNVNIYYEWGAASAVAVVLLLMVGILLWMLHKVLALDRVFSGH